MYYIQPSLDSDNSIVRCQECFLYTYTGVGLSALLVSTGRAMRRPLHCGTSDRTGSTFLFVYLYTEEYEHAIRMPDGVKTPYYGTKCIYASVAFFVPVRKVMAKSELTLASPETIDFASFVLYPNASCKAFRLRKKKEENTSTLSKTLQYQSRFDGKQKIMRKVNVVPYIIKSLIPQHYNLIFFIST